MRRNESKQKFDLIYKDFKGLVANKAELILIPEIYMIHQIGLAHK